MTASRRKTDVAHHNNGAHLDRLTRKTHHPLILLSTKQHDFACLSESSSLSAMNNRNMSDNEEKKDDAAALNAALDAALEDFDSAQEDMSGDDIIDKDGDSKKTPVAKKKKNKPPTAVPQQQIPREKKTVTLKNGEKSSFLQQHEEEKKRRLARTKKRIPKDKAKPKDAIAPKVTTSSTSLQRKKTKKSDKKRKAKSLTSSSNHSTSNHSIASGDSSSASTHVTSNGKMRQSPAKRPKTAVRSKSPATSRAKSPKRPLPPLRGPNSRRPRNHTAAARPMKRKSVYEQWKNFFFRRTSVDGCKVGGLIRIGFAICFLLDRQVLSRDLDFFLSPTRGVLGSSWPTAENAVPTATTWSLLHIQPPSDEFLWQLHWIAVAQGVLLLLGILPRLQVLGIFLHLVSLQRHNQLMLDDEDTLLRLWSFFLLFLPLHHFTIYDFFRKYRHYDESWSLWPFRLWQIQICLVYASSALNKLLARDPAWRQGTAIYWLFHASEHFPGLLNPELFFNRVMPLKALCWSLLFLESTCWISIWFDDAKGDIIGVMFVLHIFMDIATNRLAFNWLMVIGWMAFLVQPDYLPPLDRRRMLRRRTAFYLQPPRLPRGILGILLQTSVLLFSIILFVATLPSQAVVSPQAQGGLENLRSEYLNPLLHSVGIWQSPWHLYKIESFSEISHFQAFVQLDNGEVMDRRSPTWRVQEWWDRKQSTRLLKFFSKFASSKEMWVEYCEHLAKEANDSVTGIQLIRLWERPRPPISDSRWLAQVWRPPQKGWETLLVFHPCRDFSDKCTELATRGACSSKPQLMLQTCRKTCGFCTRGDVTWGNEQDLMRKSAESPPIKEIPSPAGMPEEIPWVEKVETRTESECRVDESSGGSDGAKECGAT